jgi:HSP20 family protein
MHRLFNDIFHGRLHGARQTNSGQREPIMPSIDVSETDGKVRIRAELPGVGDRDIDVPLDGDVLTIRGEKRFEGTDDDKGSYHLVVRSYGKLQRALRLPWPVDPGRVVAAFDNGVLTVTLPKGVEPETSREISQRKAGDLRPDRQSIGRRRRRV